MKTVLGVSAFGLQDCVFGSESGCRQTGFYPASVVLPTSPLGRILTGEEAHRERTHLGLAWPPEARIQPDQPIRRSPIATVWRAIVEAGDHIVRWNAGHGVSFSLARILASHVKDLVTGDVSLEDSLPSGNKTKVSSALVVAIPDHLDEFGQEHLLRELAALECPEVMLVWRPVAAALSWLDQVEGDFPTRMGENDHIHVICLYPDAIEFTTFRLRVKEDNNQYYVLPLRDRPKDLPSLTGMDWAGRLLEVFFKDIDAGAFWQAFIQFPEIWQALAGQNWDQDDLPRPWSGERQWTLWNPASDLCRYVYDIRFGLSARLRQLVKKSLEFNAAKEALSGSFGDAFRREVRRMGQVFPGGRLRGMIVCGPLAPCTIPPWLSTELELLVSRGLKVEGNLAEAEAGRLWLSADCEDPISKGAAIYGHRRLAQIPSYLDTMPQISILAHERGRFTWVPLLEAQEVFGGEEHKDTIKQRFQLEAGKRNLSVYLYKGAVDDAPSQTEGSYDPKEISLEGVSPCRARLIRKIVQRLGNLKTVQTRDFFRGTSREAQYGRAFAEAIFAAKGTEEAGNSKMSPSNTGWTPLRRAVFDFPSAPESDVALDIEVRIRPASGLARIEILPEENSFLQGERVLLNYSTMRFASSLPKRMRGWPRTEEIAVDPEDSVLCANANLVEVFENTLPTARDYKWVIDDLRDKVIKGSTLRTIAGLQIFLGAVDQDGRACTPAGNKILDRIASKFESDFRRLQMERRAALLNKMFTRAAWLYASTPTIIVAHIRGILRAGFNSRGWNWAVEAASRAFVRVEDFRLLFQSIADLASSGPFDDRIFTIQAARSICRVLMLRRDGERGLDREMAQLFAHRALKRLLKEQENNNFSILYFQMIRLLLYLLRFRRTDPACFDPSFPQSIFVFEEAKKSMAFAKNYFPRHSPRVGQVQRIIDGFDKYLHYEGTEDVISILRDLAEGDG